MDRKSITTVIGITVLGLSGAAVSRPGFVEQARVIEAEPVYETVTVSYPVTECRTERVVRDGYRRGGYVAPIAGGILGGVLGHELGRNRRGETALTVAGTLLGATLGHGLQSSHARYRPAVEHVRRCESVDRYEEEQRLTGYQVTYRYDGRIFHTYTTEHPGKYIPVRVKVSAAGES
ncbi:MAG: glycine zipper 2TM domain-containing protein [Sedimenticolaceae bacterium]